MHHWTFQENEIGAVPKGGFTSQEDVWMPFVMSHGCDFKLYFSKLGVCKELCRPVYQGQHTQQSQEAEHVPGMQPIEALAPFVTSQRGRTVCPSAHFVKDATSE